MADCNCGCGHHHEDEDYEVQLVTLIDEDGNEQDFEVIEIFEVTGQEYVAIALPEDAEEADDEVMIFRLEMDEETHEELLVDIKDDDEWNLVSETYMALDEEE